MNEELQKQLAEVVRKSMAVAEKTGEFVLDQAPELLQEFYRWHLASEVMGVVLGIVLILSGRFIPYVWLDKEGDELAGMFFSKYGDEGVVLAYIFFLISLVLGISFPL